MILAGSDTTATTLAFALAELARRPEVAAAAAAEVDAVLGDTDPASIPAEVYQTGLPLLAGIASETLRLYPAVTETGRVAAQDEVFGEYMIPAGTTVLPSMFSLQR
jgi:cytochrome P450